MQKNVKTIVVLVLVYILVFYVGFKSGISYLRMKGKIKVESIEVPAPLPPAPAPVTYYIIEKMDRGTFSYYEYSEVSGRDIFIKLLHDQKLRHLLKLRDIQIYQQDTGERLY